MTEIERSSTDSGPLDEMDDDLFNFESSHDERRPRYILLGVAVVTTIGALGYFLTSPASPQLITLFSGQAPLSLALFTSGITGFAIVFNYYYNILANKRRVFYSTLAMAVYIALGQYAFMAGLVTGITVMFVFSMQALFGILYGLLHFSD